MFNSNDKAIWEVNLKDIIMEKYLLVSVKVFKWPLANILWLSSLFWSNTNHLTHSTIKQNVTRYFVRFSYCFVWQWDLQILRAKIFNQKISRKADSLYFCLLFIFKKWCKIFLGWGEGRGKVIRGKVNMTARQQSKI